MPKLKVNGIEVTVDDGMTVLQACEIAGEEIPRFCYHERLAIAGNCRMCLVEMEKSPKPIASCAMPAAEGMSIHTNTPKVKKAREGVMEFLLINHPLDCPICDQAGECDLQDQAMTYGKGDNRFHENKRAVADKNFGPLIQTHMTRCIHCTRCVRFSREVAGVEEIGAIGRGEHMEITSYLEKSISSELSGNVIDLCPVGALTSKPYEFKARSWELKKTESICVLDGVGSNIRIDSRGMEVMRILPKLNEDINEEWISDKTRFAYDGLKVQRLDSPMIKQGGKFEKVSFEEAYKFIAKKINQLNGKEMAVIAGDLVDLETMKVAKDLFTDLGSPNIDCRQYGEKLSSENRASYLFNTSISGIEKADLCILIGCNPRLDAPIINARIRKKHVAGNFKVYSVGSLPDMTYPVEDLGDDIDVLNDIIKGKHALSEKLKLANNPMIIIGNDVVAREDGEAIISLCTTLCNKFNFIKNDWNGYNLLLKAAARVGGLDIGFVPGKNGKNVASIIENAKSGKIKLVYLIGADEIDTSNFANSFIIYQGHHGDRGAHAADVILPGCAYTEKNATYVNVEGRVQRTRRAVFGPGLAKEDWLIIKDLSEYLNVKLPYNSLSELRTNINWSYPHLAKIDAIFPTNLKPIETSKALNANPIKYDVRNFYMTDPISRASNTMAKCSNEFGKKAE